MNTIYTIRTILDNLNNHELEDYSIVFGNRSEGWNCNRSELIDKWKIAIRNSQSNFYGDVSLYYKDILIRAVHNANLKILDKTNVYKCEYKKYKINK